MTVLSRMLLHCLWDGPGETIVILCPPPPPQPILGALISPTQVVLLVSQCGNESKELHLKPVKVRLLLFYQNRTITPREFPHIISMVPGYVILHYENNFF